MLYDHVDLRVSSFDKTRGLYDALLPAMGYERVVADAESICYYRQGDERLQAFLGLVLDPGHRPNQTRLAFRAPDRVQTDRLAEIADGGGSRLRAAPRLRGVHAPLLCVVLRGRRRQQARDLLQGNAAAPIGPCERPGGVT